MHTLNLEEIKPFLSNYITGGYKQDNVYLQSIEIGTNSIIGKVSIDDFFMPGDGEYHFTSFHSEAWVSQLLIIYGCISNSLPKKPGEAYMCSLNIKLKKRIIKTKDITLDLAIKKMKLVNNRIYLRATFDIENKSFYGDISGVICLGLY